MTQLSNSLFFHVIDVPPLPDIGWQIKVRDPVDVTTLLAVIAEFVEVSIGPELSAPGAGSITMDLDSPFWATTLPNGQSALSLRDQECVWEAWEDGALRFQWLGTNVSEHIVEDDETRQVTISGPGIGNVLTWGVTLRPGFPAPTPAGMDPVTYVSSSDTVPSSHWEFPPPWPAMRMWWTIFKSVQRRGTIPMVTPLFTDTTDSAGQPWEYVPTIPTTPGGGVPAFGFSPTPGQTLLEFLNDCTGQDYSKWFAMRAEWYMWPGFRLDVRKVIGTHREDRVIFYEGGIEQKERTRVRDALANYVVVVDNEGSTSLATDTASIARWNQRERLEDKNANVTDGAKRNALSQTFLQQYKDEKSQWVIKVPYDQPGRQPFRDYGIGDWIGIASYNSSTSASVVDPFRVMAIVVHVADDTTTVELTLQSKLEARQKQLEQQLLQIINTIGSGTLPGVTPPPADGNTRPITIGPGGKIGYGTPIGTGGFGGSGGVQVYIQSTEPTGANTGDFWFDTTVVASVDTPTAYVPEPQGHVVADDMGHYVHFVYDTGYDQYGHPTTWRGN